MPFPLCKTNFSTTKFLAAKAQLNTCTCPCVCVSVRFKPELLPVYTPLYSLMSLCAPLCFIPLYKLLQFYMLYKLMLMSSSQDLVVGLVHWQLNKPSIKGSMIWKDFLIWYDSKIKKDFKRRSWWLLCIAWNWQFKLFLSRIMISKFERIPWFYIKFSIIGEIWFPKFDICTIHITYL